MCIYSYLNYQFNGANGANFSFTVLFLILFNDALKTSNLLEPTEIQDLWKLLDDATKNYDLSVSLISAALK